MQKISWLSLMVFGFILFPTAAFSSTSMLIGEELESSRQLLSQNSGSGNSSNPSSGRSSTGQGNIPEPINDEYGDIPVPTTPPVPRNRPSISQSRNQPQVSQDTLDQPPVNYQVPAFPNDVGPSYIRPDFSR